MATNTTQIYWNAVINSTDCLVLQFQKREFIPWNNSDNIVSDHTSIVTNKAKVLVFVPITFLVGFPANIINMLVFYKHGLKERINVCLFALSLADFLYILINTLNSGEHIYFNSTKVRFGPVNTWFINNLILGLNGASWVSQILSAIVASERCFCILQPLKSREVLRTSTMTIIIVAIFIVVIGLRFLVVTRIYVTCAYDPGSDSIITTATSREFYFRHKKVIDFVDSFLYGLGIPCVTIIVVVVTTVITVIKLRQAAEWRAGTSSSSNSVSAQDLALTRMLVGNSVLFIVCVFPVGLFRVTLLFVPELNAGRRYHNMFLTGLSLSHIFTLTNCTFNIVIYYTMGSRYRQTFHTMLGMKCTKKTPNKQTDKC